MGMKKIHDLMRSEYKLGGLLGVCALALVALPASTESTSIQAIPFAPLGAVTAPDLFRTVGFGEAQPTADVRWLANRIAHTRDHGGRAFIVVDKPAAQLHAFNIDAQWVASSAVLLGLTLGDESVPGIGVRPMGLIQKHERTTPAGRFVGEQGRNANGEDVVWVDYDAAVSMHRVRLTNPSERRADRLASPTADDNRISYGCINVPATFYDLHIRPVFSHQHANIYVMPDVKSVQQVFDLSPIASPTAGGLLRPTTLEAATTLPEGQFAIETSK